jgi:hypothetical protein
MLRPSSKLITDDFLKPRMKSDRLIQVQWDKLGSDRLIPVRSSLSVGLKTEKNDKNHDFFFSKYILKIFSTRLNIPVTISIIIC